MKIRAGTIKATSVQATSITFFMGSYDRICTVCGKKVSECRGKINTARLVNANQNDPGWRP